MKRKPVAINIAVLIVISAFGLTQFAENVRAVQIVGLFASGTAFGVALSMIFAAFGLRKKENN